MIGADILPTLDRVSLPAGLLCTIQALPTIKMITVGALYDKSAVWKHIACETVGWEAFTVSQRGTPPIGPWRGWHEPWRYMSVSLIVLY